MPVGFKTLPAGPFEGCVIFDWGGDWPLAIPVVLGIYAIGVPLMVALAAKGHRMLAMALFPVVFTFVLLWIAPWCGWNAVREFHALQTLGNFVIVLSLYLMSLFVLAPPKHDSFLGWLMYKRMGKPTPGLGEKDLYFFGPLNEFKAVSAAETLGMCWIAAWLAFSVGVRYADLMHSTDGEEYIDPHGNRIRAFGRAMSQATIRLLMLSVVSPSRNTIATWLIGIPFERAVMYHKMFGRAMMVCFYVHVICMIIGGTEAKNVKWSNKFSLLGTGTNLWCGVVAFVFWNLLVLMSLPYFRRKLFDGFYWIHLNLFFVAQTMTVFHARAVVLPYVIPGILLFWIDAALRFMAKYRTVSCTSLRAVSKNMVKVDLKVGPNWPNKSHSYHPGCYIWLSVNLKEPVEGLFANQKLPGAPPSGLPSWLFFHPITVVDYNEDTGTITLLIKDLSGDNAMPLLNRAPHQQHSLAPAMHSVPGTTQTASVPVMMSPVAMHGHGVMMSPVAMPNATVSGTALGGNAKAGGAAEEAVTEAPTEWAGQLLRAAHLVEAGHMALDNVRFHVGGPNGALMIKQPLEELDQVVMVSGGIGITPVLAIYNDIRRKAATAKTVLTFIWCSRDVAEIEVIAPYLGPDATVYYTGPVSDAPRPGAYQIARGRPGLDEILQPLLQRGKTSAVLTCGPTAMMDAVEQRVVDAQRAGATVLYHRETFEW